MPTSKGNHSSKIAMLVAAEHDASSRHFCWVDYLKLFFEICYALGGGSISADEMGYLGISCVRKNFMQVVLNFFS